MVQDISMARSSLRELFKEEKQKEIGAENEMIYAAYVCYGYSMKEIAEHLGLHDATMSGAVKRVGRRSDVSMQDLTPFLGINLNVN